MCVCCWVGMDVGLEKTNLFVFLLYVGVFFHHLRKLSAREEENSYMPVQVKLDCPHVIALYLIVPFKCQTQHFPALCNKILLAPAIT